ncbi:ArsR family transcriptional regulator [Cupriavidus sp. 2KB_3]|uniref:ArsR family transcriptional regulator n=1 Tax=Cupriavidus sp. 2KB_3 TaxID=3232980 RepID=UPI003F8E289E
MNQPEDNADEDTLDPVLAGILGALWQAAREPGGGALSLARLSKRAAVQMSVLRRVLTQLAEADLAEAEIDESGRGTARLTAEGRALCDELFETPGALPDLDDSDDDEDPGRSEHLPRIH